MDINHIVGVFSETLGLIVRNLIFVIILIMIFYAFKFIRHNKEQRAETNEIRRSGQGTQRSWLGVKEEKKQEKKKGSRIAALGRWIEKKQKKSEAEEKSVGGKKDKTEKKKEKLIENITKSSEKTIQLEEKTAELQETIIAAVADISNETQDIKKEVKEKKQIQQVQEKETVQIEALSKSIKTMNKFNQINSKTAEYFHNVLQSTNDHLKKQILYEEQNEEHQKGFIKRLRKSIKHLREIILHANKLDREIGKKERKEKKGFGKEIKAIFAIINIKRVKLLSEIAKGKKADPQVITELKKEIAMLKKNKKYLTQLDDSLKNTYKILEKEIKSLRSELRKVMRLNRSANKYARGLRKREKELEKRFKKLKDQQEKIEKAIGKFKGAQNIHQLVLSYSEDIKKYFETYNGIISEDINFENILKNIALNNILIEKKMLSVLKLLEGLENSEEAIEKGAEAAIEIASVVFSEDVSGSLVKLTKEINNSGIDEYQKKVSKYMQAVVQQIEKETLLINQEIEGLIKSEKRLISQNQALHKEEQQNLGNSMGTMINRKVAISDKYVSQAEKFSNQLNDRNKVAAKAFQQAKSFM